MNGDYSHILKYGGESKIVANGRKFKIVFNIESRCVIINKETDKKIDEYFQCEACRTERCFSRYPIFKDDGMTFIPVFGSKNGMLYRSNKTNDFRKASTYCYDENILNGYSLRLKYGEYHGSTLKKSVVPALNGRQFVARTTIDVGEEMYAIIEYPIRTLNVSERIVCVQPDTGPVIVPIRYDYYDEMIEWLAMAYVGFYEKGIVNFIVEKFKDGVCDYTENYMREAINELYYA